MAFESFPFIIGWELTLACNLQCRHCGSTAGLPRENELTLKECLGICDQFPELLVQEVIFTGGEPLLRPEWFKIASYLRKLEISVKILSNGITLNPKLISQLKKVGILGVGVSIDGMAETHDYIRGKQGLFDRTIKATESVIKAGIPVTVITTVNTYSINDLESLFNIISSIGVQTWQIQPIFPYGRSLEDDGISLSRRSYIRLAEIIRDLTLKGDKTGVEIRPGDSFGYFTEYDMREPPWRGCPAGLVSCGITSDGKIKGCLSFPDDLIEGDLRKDDLWNIWFHPDSFRYTRHYSKEKLGVNCQTCDQAELCRGGCTAMSYGSTGKFHNDPLCLHRFLSPNGTPAGNPASEAVEKPTAE